MTNAQLTPIEVARDAVSNAACDWIEAASEGGEDSAINRFDKALAAFEEAVREDERHTLSVRGASE